MLFSLFQKNKKAESFTGRVLMTSRNQWKAGRNGLAKTQKPVQVKARQKELQIRITGNFQENWSNDRPVIFELQVYPGL